MKLNELYNYYLKVLYELSSADIHKKIKIMVIDQR